LSRGIPDAPGAGWNGGRKVLFAHAGKPSGGLDRNMVLYVCDFVPDVQVNESGFVLAHVLVINPPVNTDNDPVTRAGLARGCAIDRNNSRVVLGAYGVRGKTLAVVYVVDIDLLILMDARPLQQVPIYRT